MGNSNENEGQTNPPQQPPPKSGSSKIVSKGLSSFGDPDAEWNNHFQEWANEDKIAGLDAVKTYQIYEWQKGTFDHWSVVIGCKSRSDVGFVTMELVVKADIAKIIPYSRFIEREKGDEYIKNKKWERSEGIADTFDLIRGNKIWNGEITTTMRKLMKLCLDLIKHHGKYSKIANSCQDFVGDFILKCAEHNAERGYQPASGGGDVVVGSSSILGTVGGAAIGAAAAGPLGAIIGASYGAVGGHVAGLGSFLVAQSSHNNEAKQVKLEKDDD